MALRHPRSVPKLVLYGFGVVSLPLIVALAVAALHVNRLAEQSRDTVYQAVRAVESSRMLIEQLTAMERNARQYLVLGDPALFDAYRNTHESFRSTARALYGLPLDPDHHDKVSGLVEEEGALFEALKQAPAGKGADEAVKQRFARLTDMAQGVLSAGNEMIDREVRRVHGLATTAQQILFWLAVSLIPLSLISAGVFTVLITRPVRQLDRVIRRLGDGRFDERVQVQGPDDLRYLGERLEWLRARLNDLEEQKTRFLRHVSHELKTPLTTIRESGDLLNERAVGSLNAEQREVVRILQDSAGRLQQLIEDLLTFSTVRLEAPALSLAQVDLKAMVHRLLESHKPVLMGHGMELDEDLEEVTVIADEAKLRSVIDNLVSNAIKFSPEGGSISVTLRRGRGQAVIDVIDSGPGIRPEERDRVFNAFFQGEVSTRGYVQGSGLGLAIAREYLEAHGGRIEIVERRGRGAHLRVLLPVEQIEDVAS